MCLIGCIQPFNILEPFERLLIDLNAGFAQQVIHTYFQHIGDPGGHLDERLHLVALILADNIPDRRTYSSGSYLAVLVMMQIIMRSNLNLRT
jgi:hypothetical protein